MTDHGTHRQRHKRCWQSLVRHFKEKLLLILTIVGIVIGFTVGFSVRLFEPSEDLLLWLGLPGEVFIRMLKMMTLPLIVCSIISGSASVEPQLNGKMTVVACLYAFITNAIACLLAVFFCIIIKPGKGLILSDSARDTDIFQTQDIFADLIRNLLPDNMVEAAFTQARTRYDVSTLTHALNTTNGIMFYNTTTITKSLGKVGSSNLIGLIVVSMILGLATNSIGAKGKPFLKFFASASEIILVILRWFLWATPIGVCSLIAVSLAAIVSLQSTFTQLAMLIVTVIVAIVIHQFLLIPSILLIFLRRSPVPFLLSLARPWMVAFASCSTAAALPEMIRTCEEGNNKIDKRVTRFVIPLCVSINADGSAIYVTTSAIFVATVTGNDTSVGSMFVIGILTAIAALAIPSVPSASIVTLIMILTSLNIDAKTVGLLFAVEWLLDRVRTGCNVFSHTTGAVITYQLCRESLRRSVPPLKTTNHDNNDNTELDKFLQTETV